MGLNWGEITAGETVLPERSDQVEKIAILCFWGDEWNYNIDNVKAL